MSINLGEIEHRQACLKAYFPDPPGQAHALHQAMSDIDRLLVEYQRLRVVVDAAIAFTQENRVIGWDYPQTDEEDALREAVEALVQAEQS